MPETVLLGQLRDPRLRLRRPIVLDICRENGAVTVMSEEYLCYGWGKYLTEAIEDFQVLLAEEFWALQQEHERLGPGLKRVWERLQANVVAVKEVDTFYVDFIPAE